jgi:DNA-binding transcriptional regulator YiaG
MTRVEQRRRSSRAQPWDDVLSPEWIAALRAALGFDRSRFARLVGVRSPNTLKAWENGWNAVADRAAARAMLDVAAVWLPVWPLAGMKNPEARVQNQALEPDSKPAPRPRRRKSSRTKPWDEVLSPEWIAALRATLGYDRGRFARLVGVRSSNTQKSWENGWNAVADRAAARAMLDLAAVWLPVWPWPA